MITKTGFNIVNYPLLSGTILSAAVGAGSAIQQGSDVYNMDEDEKQIIKKDKNLPEDADLARVRAIRGLVGGGLGAFPGAYLAAKGVKNMHLGKMIAGTIGANIGGRIGAGIANAHYGRARADYLQDPDGDI